MSVVDYVATCSFMWINKKCLPSKIAFVSVHEPSVVFTVEPDPSTCYFSMQDVLLNMSLPANPFDVKKEPGEAFVVPVWDMERYISRDFHTKYLERQDIWEKGIVGCLDIATYNYLFPLLPLGTVKYLGITNVSPTLEAQHAAQVLSNNNSGKDE
ncbi:hypothetical protein JTE90_001037 [Oedothorax gibbosus]|uniref:Uncharacterized protein n=1 Tax=Oedothorax gibbosus TaxID=931172 RepID=A0AAV6TJB0_9ARAC|nr:hypothetical protein JTE90_001037 [Oedothorax gibbosus]